MKFISEFLEKRWRKKLQFYHEQSEYYYSLYQSKKDLAIIVRKPYPIWMHQNDWANSYKKESEQHREKYLYWNSKFKKLKKKLNSLH